MPKENASRLDLFLLLSLLFVIILYPLVEHTGFGRALAGFAILVPLSVATIELSQLRGWGRQCLVLVACVLAFSIANTLAPHPIITSARWISVAIFLLLSVWALFSYLRTAEVVATRHLYTAISIYLLLAMLWFAFYSAIEAVRPGSFLHSATGSSDRPSDLLYFSFITLTTAGYGDILPVSGVVRILAALESSTGVLYVAIMISLLVSAYRPSKS